MKRYKWRMVDVYDNTKKLGSFEAKSISAAKRKATKESGIAPRIWSSWYFSKHWTRDNDISGKGNPETVRFLCLEQET